MYQGTLNKQTGKGTTGLPSRNRGSAACRLTQYRFESSMGPDPVWNPASPLESSLLGEILSPKPFRSQGLKINIHCAGPIVRPTDI